MQRYSARAKKECCPFVSQTWIALGYLICAIFFMALLQLYPDSLPDYPPECQSLSDVGFSIIPQLTDSYSIVADLLVLIAISTFLVLTPFFLATPQLAFRRWLILLGTLYLLRGILVTVTRYPRLPFKLDKYQPSNPILGALAIMAGAKSTATDIMYSGHTVNFILAASFVSRYTYYGLFSFLFWVLNILGILALLATREHYTADVIVAFVITKLAFWSYHLFFDSGYKRFWVSGLEITNFAQDERYLRLPLVIKDQDRHVIKVDRDMVSDLVVKQVYEIETGKQFDIVDVNPFWEMRNRVYETLKWLDNE